ncbi:MAG: MFS transporter [Deltaproteobacteria bacterium]|nr:MAG: MFS transporter [Deltaproteobacteria bacterium]
MSASVPAERSEAGRKPSQVPQGAGFALAVLTAMNLLNYLDRYVPSSVKDLFKKDLGLTDTQTSLPLTAFVIVYMITSPVFGSLADKWPRKVLIASGVALWSLATAAASLAHSFAVFLLARALVGVGEAAYATLSPPLLADFYPAERRNRVLTIFYIAIPVGSALGYILGGQVGVLLGWRWAFLIAGLPGLAAAALVLLVKEPGRGRFDIDAGAQPPAWPTALRLLASNREYVLAVAGYTAVTFASGALADWFPTFLNRHRAMGLDQADWLTGFSAVVGGLAGTITGGRVADALKRFTRHPYLAVCAVGTGMATLLACGALLATSRPIIIAFIFAAQFFLWWYNAPINAVLVNTVPSAMRARAFSLSILCIHLLGDAISPTVIGVVSDRSGLSFAIALVPVMLGVGTVIWAWAWRTLPLAESRNVAVR